MVLDFAVTMIISTIIVVILRIVITIIVVIVVIIIILVVDTIVRSILGTSKDTSRRQFVGTNGVTTEGMGPGQAVFGGGSTSSSVGVGGSDD